MSTVRRVTRPDLRAAAVEAAGDQSDVLSRAQLRELGYCCHDVAREVRTGRWRVHGRQTVAVHTGELSRIAQQWRAIWEVGAGIAVLDGVSALEVAGLSGFDEPLIHVSVHHSSDIVPVAGTVIHKVGRRVGQDVLTNGWSTVLVCGTLDAGSAAATDGP